MLHPAADLRASMHSRGSLACTQKLTGFSLDGTQLLFSEQVGICGDADGEQARGRLFLTLLPLSLLLLRRWRGAETAVVGQAGHAAPVAAGVDAHRCLKALWGLLRTQEEARFDVPPAARLDLAAAAREGYVRRGLRWTPQTAAKSLIPAPGNLGAIGHAPAGEHA